MEKWKTVFENRIRKSHIEARRSVLYDAEFPRIQERRFMGHCWNCRASVNVTLPIDQFRWKCPQCGEENNEVLNK